MFSLNFHQINQTLSQVEETARRMQKSEATNAQILSQLEKVEYSNHEKLRQLVDAEVKAQQQLQQLEQALFSVRSELSQTAGNFQTSSFQSGAETNAFFPEPRQYS